MDLEECTMEGHHTLCNNCVFHSDTKASQNPPPSCTLLPSPPPQRGQGSLNRSGRLFDDHDGWGGGAWGFGVGRSGCEQGFCEESKFIFCMTEGVSKPV